jgi:antitoxin (DNA-binding transcriptional repressor) of toxin-antitoxin stability system
MQITIAAGEFKAKCLQFTLVITKRGVPVAKLVPTEEEPLQLFGALKGTVEITGDIISPLDEEWDVLK